MKIVAGVAGVVGVVIILPPPLQSDHEPEPASAQDTEKRDDVWLKASMPNALTMRKYATHFY